MAPADSIQPMSALLEFQGISKSFFGVRVLKAVSFDLAAGSVMGLVGENGAGKSTLVNILGGNLRPDAGRMLLHGQPYAPQNPKAARVAGIGFVHQELNLFPNLSIAENLFLTSLPRLGPIVRQRELRARAEALLKKVRLDLPPETLLERLSTGERQLVEIAHALSFDARLIILDEPTTSLSQRECENLFALVRQLRAEGRAIIFISHALGDVLRLCDSLLVLRDGELVGHGPVSDFSTEKLVSLMVGRSLTQLYPTRDRPPGGDVALEARSLTQPGIIRDVSFQLHHREVLGIAGLMGAGRTELSRILFGADTARAGELRVGSQSLQLRGAASRRIRQRIARGLALVTESRREDGLCMEASIADNVALAQLPRFTRTPARFLDFKSIRAALAGIREAVRLQPRARDEQPVKILSGGNQQKVVLGKWLLTKPRVLILDEPTRGIDVGAKFEIYSLIHRLADEGAGVLVISSEIEELIGICDRILVMNRGRISAEFPRALFDREKILEAALPREGTA